jgi:KDO2-lipid IV(A) lauroyltransferase
MDAKRIRTSISRFAAYCGLMGCSLIVRIMPPRYVYGFARGLGALGYRLVSRQRRVAVDTLAIAFGSEKTRAEREKIAKECFVQMAKSGLELMFLMNKPELLRRRVKFIGKKNLDAALAQARGAVMVSAHFGNFPLLMCRLSLEGYTTAGIMRPMRDPRAEKMFYQTRNRYKIKTIYSQPRKECVDATIRCLRSNAVVFIPLDQNFGTGGIFVDFFGQKAATATGPVILAQRTGAALLPAFIVRQPDDTHHVFIEPPIQLAHGQSPKATVAVNIQKLTCIIESYIRRYPAEWGWVHRRWKSKPRS